MNEFRGIYNLCAGGGGGQGNVQNDFFLFFFFFVENPFRKIMFPGEGPPNSFSSTTPNPDQ